MAILVIQVVAGIRMVEVTLLLDVARGVGPGLHVGGNVPRLRPPCILPLPEVLRIAFLVRPVSRSRIRPERLNVALSSGLVGARVAAIGSGAAVVYECASCSVSGVDGLGFSLLGCGMEAAIASSS